MVFEFPLEKPLDIVSGRDGLPSDIFVGFFQCGFNNRFGLFI
jgi:hypothetical protein